MTYTFPPSLYPLRDYLKGQGADTRAFVSARQAAFMAQELLGTRVKFPDKGADMTSTLFLIQKAVTEKGMVTTTIPSRGSHDTNTPQEGKKKGNRQLPKAKSNKHNKDFSPERFSQGVHIFCDGASAITAVVDKMVTQKEMEWRTARGAEDRARMEASVKEVREAQVPRAELERVWTSQANTDSDQQRQIDELKQAQTSVYGARDVILDLRQRVDRMEREKASPGS